MDATKPKTQASAKPDNLWLNLAANAVMPAVVLSLLSGPNALGPLGSLLLALAFPLAYGLWDLLFRKRWNLLSVLGLVGTLASGGLGLLQLGGFWFAVKEAAVPLLLAAYVPLSLRTRQPLIRLLIFNEQVLDTPRIQAALEARGKTDEFERLLAWASWVVAVAMAVSAAANFLLAWWLLPAVSGTEEFNRQLAKLQIWGWPGSFVPLALGMFYALGRVMKELEAMTGLPSSELFHKPHASPAAS